MRLILDTNVWLDWLVFEDSSAVPIKTALREGRAQVVINTACLEELERVLDYPVFQLDAPMQVQHLAEVQRVTVRHTAGAGVRPVSLPRCTDPDDQKFLELARDARADWLLTKDRSLLRLSRNKLQAAGFRIGTSGQWAEAQK